MPKKIYKNRNIEELDLSVRLFQLLKQVGVKDTDTLLEMAEEMINEPTMSSISRNELLSTVGELSKEYRYKGQDHAWTRDAFMASIGYEPMPDDPVVTHATLPVITSYPYRTDEHHRRYRNKAMTQSTFYGPMGKGKRLIYFNTDFHKDYVFVHIYEDGGTRTVFHGAIRSGDELVQILSQVY